MKFSKLRCFLLSLCIATALLEGCAGSQPPIPAPAAHADRVSTHHGSGSSITFNFTGRKKKFIVPQGVTRVTITANGASGSGYGTGGFGAGGNGGLVEAAIGVTPGETLFVRVGGANGFNGGGQSGSVSYGLNGGGASDIRQGGDRLKDRVIVAGGGGGGGYYPYNGGTGGAGGAGGGKVAAPGANGGSPSGADGSGGGGGTHKAGGIGGAGGQYGFAGPLHCKDGCGHCSGAAGGNGARGNGGGGATTCGGPGGSGGGGYYGGGGGGSGDYSYLGVSFTMGAGGGGGGGSSYIEKMAAHLQNVQGGAPAGDGSITISW